jgi:hypothetical protein
MDKRGVKSPYTRASTDHRPAVRLGLVYSAKARGAGAGPMIAVMAMVAEIDRELVDHYRESKLIERDVARCRRSSSSDRGLPSED